MPSVSREGTRPLDRESSWLKMTGEWIKLAQDAELRAKSGPTLTS